MLHPCRVGTKLVCFGAVQDAVVKGWFRTSREPTKGGTHLRVVALTAYEVASAMAYIHSHGIAHLVRGCCKDAGVGKGGWDGVCCTLIVHIATQYTMGLTSPEPLLWLFVSCVAVVARTCLAATCC